MQELNQKRKKPETVYRIISKSSGEAVGSYSRAYCDEFDFNSASEARNEHCYNMEKCNIAKYKVTYELIEDDCKE